MKRIMQISVILASLFYGGTMLGTGCTNETLIWPSIRDGLFNYISTGIYEIDVTDALDNFTADT